MFYSFDWKYAGCNCGRYGDLHGSAGFHCCRFGYGIHRWNACCKNGRFNSTWRYNHTGLFYSFNRISMNEEKSFLGIGWNFPPAFDNVGSEVQMLKGEDDIQSSLQVLLATRLGERVMQPWFDCILDAM